MISAILFSLFIYLAHFKIEIPAIDTVAGVLALYLILQQNKKQLFFTGFFIGLFWFFWVGFSMQYYGFPYLIPFVSLIFAIFYGLLFRYILGFFQNPFYRAVTFILITFIEPFDFNWFKPQIIFINSYFGTELWQFAIILFSVANFIIAQELKNWKVKLLSLFIIFAIHIPKTGENNFPNFKVEVVETKVKQSEKWLKRNEKSIVEMNLNKIKQAIENNASLVILPESTFPLFLNHRQKYLNQVKELSKKIAIVTGALYSENGNYYNASYFFQNGKYQIAKKVILVPFGEYIPLPKFVANWINQIFFDGVKDFTPATKPTDFNIKNEKFRNAICYEASSEEMYKNAPKFMIAISNNGWFLPSIEPTLQKLLIQHYSNIYNITVFHSANMAGTTVISAK